MIASVPAEPRDSARLFVLDTATGEIAFDHFSNLGSRLPKEALLVLKDTKVVPARIDLYKKSGGKVELLMLLNEWEGAPSPIKVMADRKIEVGDELHAASSEIFRVAGQDRHFFLLEPPFDALHLDDFLNRYGRTPIPKYIKGIGLSERELRTRYQSVFAAKASSVAAPTASLHFTKEVFAKLKEKGVRTAEITLHVGLGTFAPVSDINLKTGKLHSESYDISYDSSRLIREAKQNHQPIVAVGTTVVRALESFASYITSSDTLVGVKDSTDIFIRPPYEFKIVGAMITNFHLPGSSLMMLVQAFLEFKRSPLRIIDLYKKAIAERFRFYSFGDAMLIK